MNHIATTSTLNAPTSTSYLDFTQPVVNIGGHPANDIVIHGPGVQPFHACLLLKDDEYCLVPLASEAVFQIDGIPFTDTIVCIDEDQQVKIGDAVLSVRLNGSPTTMHVTVTRYSVFQPDAEEAAFPEPQIPGPTPPLQAEPGSGLQEPATIYPVLAQPVVLAQTIESPAVDRIENAIQVNVQSQHDEISVEQSAFFVFEIVNIGIIVEHFLVAVRGLPEQWVQLSTPRVQLMKGERSTLHLSITPPRLPTSTAGKRAFDLVFTSPNYPDQEYRLGKELTIHPYTKFSVGSLSPQKINIPWRKHTGKTVMPISNQGNYPAEFNVTAVDEGNECSFDFRLDAQTRLYRQAVITIPAGETANLPIEITPRKQPVVAFASNRYLFTTAVQVAEPTIMPQIVSGSAVYRPLFGWLSILLLTLLVLGALMYTLQPRIYSFQVAAGKDVIGLGDTTRLEWMTSPFASLIDISNIDQPIHRGQTSLTVAPAQSTTYELTASNWLSNLLGLSYKFIQTILVIPPQPHINVFETDQTSVAKGKPVLLRWSATQADQVFLTIDEVVYELSKEEFSGERQVILDKDALVTLEARNASGRELRSYFINVVPPAITVQAFTVWVRPAPESAYQAGPAKQAALTRAPDPNFPVKFVELVPDNASEIGYRVEFYQPERELQKGEQVIVEWNVIGTDNGKLQIAPFEDQLPARGSQPYFPQESMNFVMTAKSGELELLYMLPVKVFDGEPPQPPKIEFFKASPVKMVGAGDVQFAWSVSGEWTRVQIASGDEVIADYLNPQGFKTVRVDKSATFILTAWNGSLSSASPVEVTVDPALIPLTLQVKSVYPTSGRFLIGDKLAVTVAFTDVPADKPDPTGKIIVTDGFSNCTITLPAVTCDLTFNTPGLKSITASYEGDKIYLQADSDPYPGTITVASLSVNLNPKYYYLNLAGTGPGAPIDDLANTPLKLDQGLYVKVNVQPVNTVLVDDQKGKVTLSVCEQELQNGLPVAKVGTCVFTGTATVVQSTVDNEFYADLILKNFPSAGTRVLLFEYRHDNNAISPTSYTQVDVKVNKMGLYLSLPLCVTNPDTFADCEVGVTDASNAKILFDIKKGDDKSLLSSVMPKPASSAFRVFDYSVAPQKDWTCTVVTKNSTYKLDCTANFVGLKNVNWLYSFDSAKDPNYTFASGNNGFSAPFYLKVVESTNLVLSIPSNVKAGEGIRLTGPQGTVRYVQILDSQGSPIDPAGGLRLADNDPSNTGAYAITSNSNCLMDASTGDITIPSVTAPCEIYFKAMGTYQLTISYLGDNNNYAPSASNTQVAVTRQTGITAGWKYQENSIYKDWGTLNAWAVNTSLPIRITFADAPKFIAESLVGMTLNVTIKNGQNPITSAECTSPAVTNGVHQATILRYPSGEVVVEFTLTCIKTPMRLTIALSLVDPTHFDFMAPESRQLLITQNNQGAYGFDLTVEIVRSPGGQSVVTAGPPAKIETLFVGETYLLTVKAETIFDYFDTLFMPSGPQSLQELLNRYSNLRAYLDLPDYLANRIDPTNTTCPASSDPTYDIEIPLQNTNSTGYEYQFDIFGTIFRWGYADIRLRNDTPCALTFTTGAQDLSTNAATFSFSAASNFLGIYSDDNTYGTSGLRRQNVTLSPVAFSGYAGLTQAIVFNLTREVDTNPLLPLEPASSFSSQFALSLPATCGVTRNTSLDAVNSATQAQFGLNLPLAACSGDITITYNGNSYFNSLTQNVTITVNRHSTQLSGVQYKQGANFTAFPPANLKAGDSLEMRIQVSDGDTPAHTLIPGGTLEIWLSDSSGNPLEGGGATPAYTLAQSTGGGAIAYDSGTKRYSVTLTSSGDGLFTITFNAAATNVTLRYRYTGSASFNPQPATGYLQTGPFTIAP